MTKVLIADLEEAVLLADCAKTVERGIQHVTPEAPCRYTAALVITKPVEPELTLMLLLHNNILHL